MHEEAYVIIAFFVTGVFLRLGKHDYCESCKYRDDYHHDNNLYYREPTLTTYLHVNYYSMSGLPRYLIEYHEMLDVRCARKEVVAVMHTNAVFCGKQCDVARLSDWVAAEVDDTVWFGFE